MSIRPLQELIRSAREERGLSRETVARRASRFAPEEIGERDVYALECEYQRLPPPSLVVPVVRALDMDRELVLRTMGLWW